MKKRKYAIKKIILTTFLAAGTLMLTSCGKSKEQDKNTIKVYTMQTDLDEDLKKYAEDFEKKNPGYKVEISTEYQSYSQRLLMDLTAGICPDVIEVDESIPRDLYDYNLQPIGEKSDLEKQYRYLSGSTIDGKVYTLPLGVTVEGGVLYDQTVLKQAGITELPKTPEELEEMLVKISDGTKDQDIIPLYTCYKQQTSMTGWNPLATSLKANTNFEQEYMNLKNPFENQTVFQRTYKVLYDANKKKLTEIGRGNMDSVWEEAEKFLKQHKIGAVVASANEAEELIEEHPDEYVYQPFTAEDGKQYLQMEPQYGLGISRTCKNPELAKKWIAYLYQDTDYLEKCQASYMRTDKEDSKLVQTIQNQGIQIMNPVEYKQDDIKAYEEKVTNSELAVDSGYLGWHLIDLMSSKDWSYDEICKRWNESWNAKSES